MCLSGTSSLLTRTPARYRIIFSRSLHLSFSRRTSLTQPRATPAWLSESVHSSLCSFSFHGISYGLLSNHAASSKYSFATNFHLHVFSPFGSLTLLRARPSSFSRFRRKYEQGVNAAKLKGFRGFLNFSVTIAKTERWSEKHAYFIDDGVIRNTMNVKLEIVKACGMRYKQKK